MSKSTADWSAAVVNGSTQSGSPYSTAMSVEYTYVKSGLHKGEWEMTQGGQSLGFTSVNPYAC